MSASFKEMATAGSHNATVLCAPKAIRPDFVLEVAALGVRLVPIEMKFSRIESIS